MKNYSEKENKYHKLYIDIAHRVAQMSFCKRLQVGAIAVKENRIISMGWNGQPAGFSNCCEDQNNVTFPTVLHAESNLLMKITSSHESAQNAVVYVTHSPCLSCAKLLYQAGIKKVFYVEEYGGKEGIDFLLKCGVEVMLLQL